MKHSTARERLTKEERLGGSVCIGCGEFVPKGEERHCDCPLGYAGVYITCNECGTIFYENGPGPGECRSCMDRKMREAYADPEDEEQ